MLTVYVTLFASVFAAASPAMAFSVGDSFPRDAPFDRLCLGSAGDRFDRRFESTDPAEPSPEPLAGPAMLPLLLPPPTPDSGAKFASSFAMISGFEVSLLVGTMMLPKSFTGWEDDFIQDGMGNLGEAWSRPPVWDTDHWFHNYVGHPYGGSIYYNTLRSRGGSPFQSFLFSATMSAWWEYALEAVAERPSIQDLIVTPVTGSLLGEFTHRLAVRMRRDGSGFAEKVFLSVLNPTHMIFGGDP